MCVLNCWFIPGGSGLWLMLPSNFFLDCSSRKPYSGTMHPPMPAILGNIWKPMVGKRQSNATCVILHHMTQAVWGDIWKYTGEKCCINVTSVNIDPLRQAIWGDIRKYTMEKSLTNVTTRADVLRRHVKTHNGEKANCNQCGFTSSQTGNLRTQRGKVKQMQPVWFYMH